MKKFFSFVAAALVAGTAFAELTTGEYYIQNVSSGLYFCGQNYWGTQGTAAKEGTLFSVEKQADGTYGLKNLELSCANVYFGDNLYVDNASSVGAGQKWTLAEVSEGVYTIANAAGFVSQSATPGYHTGFPLEQVAEAGAAAQWRFLTRAEAVNQLLAADASNPVEATFLVSNSNFSRNHSTAKWTVGGNCTNKNLAGGQNENMCAESFHSTFDIYQTLTGIPNGKYVVKAQGFYRQDGTDTENLALFYANDKSVALPEKTGTENSMSEASASFAQGLYYTEPLEVEVTDGNLQIGFKTSNTALWCIWDNVELTCVEVAGLADLQATFNNLVAEAETLASQEMDADVLAALVAAMATPEQTAEAYTAAIENLTNAIAAAKLSMLKYSTVIGTEIVALAPASWTGATGGYGAYAERYNTFVYNGDIMTKSISGLKPNAMYTVSFIAAASTTTSRDNISGAATGDDLTCLFVNDSVKFIPVVERLGVGAGEYNVETVTGVVGEDGVLTFGMKNVQTGGNWFVIDASSIVYAGKYVSPLDQAMAQLDAAVLAIEEQMTTLNTYLNADEFAAYPEVVATYVDALVALQNKVTAIKGSAAEDYAAGTLVETVAEYIAQLPTTAELETLKAEFDAAIEEAKAAETPAQETVALKTWNFRDANQFPKDVRVTVASLTIEYDTLANGVMLYESTDPMWDGLVFQPAKNDGTQSWWVRPRNGGTDYGLAAINQNLWFAVKDLHAGYKVTVEAKNAMPLADSTMVAEIVKNEKTACGYGVSYTYTMAQDGMLAFQNNGNYMYQIIVEAPVVARYAEIDYNFRDANQFPVDVRVEKASLTIAYDTVPGGITLYESTNPMWAGLVFEPTNNDGTQSWWVRRRNTGTDYGLAAVNQNRWFAAKDLKAGAKVTVEAKNAMPLADSTMVSDIVKNEKTTCGYGVSYTYTIAKAGMLAFQNNGNYMYRVLVEQPVLYLDTDEMNFRDANQFPKDTRVQKATLTIAYDTVPGGIMLYESTDPMWEGLVFEPTQDDNTRSWWVRARNTGTDYGLAAVNQNRWFGVKDLRAGESVTIEAKNAMPLADSTMVAEIVKNDATACGYGVSYTYTMAKAGMLALQNNGNYMYRIITNRFGGLVEGPAKPTISVEGEDWTAKLVTIEHPDTLVTLSYSIDGGEAVEYTEPFYVTSSCQIAASAELNGLKSAATYLDVVAGYLVTPVGSVIATKDEERTVVFSSASTGASLRVNVVENDSVLTSTITNNPDTIVVSEPTQFQVMAVYNSELTGPLCSDTLKMTVAAGEPLKLNKVGFQVVEQTDEQYILIMKSDNSNLIGSPVTPIDYEVYPTEEKATVNSGDTLVFPTHVRITATVSAEGYASSEPAVLWTREAAKLESVWMDDFKTLASENLESGQNYGVVLQEVAFSAAGYDFCPVQVLDDYISNVNFGVQSGTSWLQRNAGGYLGLYNYNSGPRRFGINNLRKTQVVKLTVSDVAGANVQLDNDVLELDEANSVGNTLYYNCVKDGIAVLNMARYYCIWQVEVLNNPDVTASPNIYIAGMNEDGSRQMAVLPATVKYPANQFTYFATAADATAEAEFAEYEEKFNVSKANNTVLAYTEYEGKASEINVVTVDCDSIYSLIDPVITWTEKGEEGHSFSVADANLMLQGLYPELHYAFNGEEGMVQGEENTLTLAGSGWLTVKAVLPGMAEANVVSRYVSEGREAYNESYVSVMDGDTLTLSAIAGDFEVAAGAVVSGEYPKSLIAVAGKQYVHYNAAGEYNNMVLPFGITIGTNVITNAQGEELKAGEDYELLTFHNWTANRLNGNKMDYLLNDTLGYNMLNATVRAEGTSIGAGVPMMFHVLNAEKVGAEVILESAAATPISVNQAVTTVPTSGWRVFGNTQYVDVTLEGKAYVLTAGGGALQLVENPVIAPFQAAIILADAEVENVGETIYVIDPSFKPAYKTFASDEIFYTTAENLVAANAEGWAATENFDNFASFVGVTRIATLEPSATSDQDIKHTQKYDGVTVRDGLDRTVHLYVTGVKAIHAYVASVGGTTEEEVRTLTIDATSADEVLTKTVETQANVTTVNTLGLNAEGEYDLKFTASKNVMLYAVKFVVDESLFTAIENIAATAETDAIYDLQGRKVQDLRAGEVYIVNGKTFMVK